MDLGLRFHYQSYITSNACSLLLYEFNELMVDHLILHNFSLKVD